MLFPRNIYKFPIEAFRGVHVRVTVQEGPLLTFKV